MCKIFTYLFFYSWFSSFHLIKVSACPKCYCFTHIWGYILITMTTQLPLLRSTMTNCHTIKHYLWDRDVCLESLLCHCKTFIYIYIYLYFSVFSTLGWQEYHKAYSRHCINQLFSTLRSNDELNLAIPLGFLVFEITLETGSNCDVFYELLVIAWWYII